MSEVKTMPSQSKPVDAASNVAAKLWSAKEAYLLAAFCLLLGVALGYLFRGSASPVAEQAAAPLIEVVNKDPKDFDSLVKIGNLYYDGQQFPNAIQYYERALVIHPENPDVRTDMGTAYWYTGNAEKALAAMETSLKYRPGHPQTLFNLGWVRWQGKQDPKGAIEAWQQLLKANPDYPQRQQVEQYIVKAKEHASRG